MMYKTSNRAIAREAGIWMDAVSGRSVPVNRRSPEEHRYRSSA